MHQDFVVVDVVTDFFKKHLDIFFNFELDPTTVTDRSIKIVENHSGSVIPISYQTDGNCISVSLKEDPVPDIEYMLVCNKEICNITHQHLRTEYVRYIQFTSTIKNEVEIITPSNLETVDKLYIVWNEKKYNADDYISRYHIQVASDNTFQHIKAETIVIDKTDMYLAISDEIKRQYYLRIRVETEKDFGPWSDIVSFVYQKDIQNKKDTDKDATSDTDIRPVVEIPLTLVEQPENGVTPESFVFTFDEPIAPDISLSDIHITRKDW